MKQLVYSTTLTKEVDDYSTGASKILYIKPYSQLPPEYVFLQETDLTHWRFKIDRDITDRARKAIERFSNNPAIELATEVLDTLEDALHSVINAEDLPKINAIEGDDNSILLEWIFTHMRIGFSIEKHLDNSSWYLVTDSESGAIQASGDLLNEDLRWLINWLICAVS